MQPSDVQRVAARREKENIFEASKLRMSSNNCRDVMRLFLGKGIVQAIREKRRRWPKYELTALGRKLQTALRKAEERHVVSS